MPSINNIMAFALFGVLGMVTAAPQESQTRNQWTKLANLPGPRQEHSTVAPNDHTIAVVGGVTAIFNGTLEIGLVTTDLVQLYDIPSNTWRTAKPAPYRVNHPNVVAVNGKIYLLGGLVDAPNDPRFRVNWVASGESHVYDPAKDLWTKLESMPVGTERGSAIAGVHGEMIYLAGGMTVLNSEYQDSVTVVTGFNTTSGKWQRLQAIAANIPEGRQHGVGSVIGDTFYVTGGRWFSQTAVRGEVFMLNLRNQEAGWKTSAKRMPVPRGGLSGAAVGNRLFTFGGEGNVNSDIGVFNETEFFDVTTQQWSRMSPMAVPRHGTSAATVGSKIYIPGGGLQQDGKAIIFNGVAQFLHSSDNFDVLSV
jgi:N-acetylneuraminic acid mutarotase